MINEYMLHNIRRTLERGLRTCQAHMNYPESEILRDYQIIIGRHADTYQHMLDELKRAGLEFRENKQT